MAQEPLSDLIESIRSRVQAELDSQLPALAARHEQAVAEARREAEAEAADRREEAVAAARREAEAEVERRVAAMTPAPAPPLSRTILKSLSAIDEADSISGTLRAVAIAASEHGGSLFVGAELEPWTAGQATNATSPTDIVKESFTAGRVLRREGAMASPLLVDGTAIGVLHAPSPSDGDGEALDIIARYAATRLGLLTATRTMQARRWITSAAQATGNGDPMSDRKTDGDHGGDDDDVQSARRYARLLVSEIRLYNETAVNEGRAHRDLSSRLGAEIDRARRLYEERVPSTIHDRARHFHHELIQTLAGGDPTLLG